MAKKPTVELDETKRLMGALVRMKPKRHEEMKVGGTKNNKMAAPKKKKGRR